MWAVETGGMHLRIGSYECAIDPDSIQHSNASWKVTSEIIRKEDEEEESEKDTQQTEGTMDEHRGFYNFNREEHPALPGSRQYAPSLSPCCGLSLCCGSAGLLKVAVVELRNT